MEKVKTKPLVQIYERKTKNGTSIYLHYTVNGEQIRENTYLRLSGNKTEDKLVRSAATKLQAEKIAQLLSNQTGLATDTPKNNVLLVDYCNILASRFETKDRRSSNAVKGNQLKKVIQYIKDVDDKIKLCNVSKKFCENILLRIKNDPLKGNTQKHYYSRFVWVLNQAIRDEYITTNPAPNVEDKPHLKNTERVYLTENELKAFADVNVSTQKANVIKKAFILSALTGLRYSDVFRLTKDHIEYSPNGDMRLKIETKKTKKYISFILSAEASKIVKEMLDSMDEKGCMIFPKASPAYTHVAVVKIAESAGIKKVVSFHTARHTFATLLLTKGADLYTVSSILGHSDLKTTQIYAKIIDKKKDDAVKLLDGVL